MGGTHSRPPGSLLPSERSSWRQRHKASVTSALGDAHTLVSYLTAGTLPLFAGRCLAPLAQDLTIQEPSVYEAHHCIISAVLDTDITFLERAAKGFPLQYSDPDVVGHLFPPVEGPPLPASTALPPMRHPQELIFGFAPLHIAIAQWWVAVRGLFLDGTPPASLLDPCVPALQPSEGLIQMLLSQKHSLRGRTARGSTSLHHLVLWLVDAELHWPNAEAFLAHIMSRFLFLLAAAPAFSRDRLSSRIQCCLPQLIISSVRCSNGLTAPQLAVALHRFFPGPGLAGPTASDFAASPIHQHLPPGSGAYAWAEPQPVPSGAVSAARPFSAPEMACLRLLLLSLPTPPPECTCQPDRHRQHSAPSHAPNCPALLPPAPAYWSCQAGLLGTLAFGARQFDPVLHLAEEVLPGDLRLDPDQLDACGSGVLLHTRDAARMRLGQFAAEYGATGLMAALSVLELGTGGGPLPTADDRYPPLHLSLSRGDAATAEALVLGPGLDVGLPVVGPTLARLLLQPDAEGNNALHLAARRADPVLLRRLLLDLLTGGEREADLCSNIAAPAALLHMRAALDALAAGLLATNHLGDTPLHVCLYAPCAVASLEAGAQAARLLLACLNCLALVACAPPDTGGPSQPLIPGPEGMPALGQALLGGGLDPEPVRWVFARLLQIACSPGPLPPGLLYPTPIGSPADTLPAFVNVLSGENRLGDTLLHALFRGPAPVSALPFVPAGAGRFVNLFPATPGTSATSSPTSTEAGGLPVRSGSDGARVQAPRPGVDGQWNFQAEPPGSRPGVPAPAPGSDAAILAAMDDPVLVDAMLAHASATFVLTDHTAPAVAPGRGSEVPWLGGLTAAVRWPSAADIATAAAAAAAAATAATAAPGGSHDNASQSGAGPLVSAAGVLGQLLARLGQAPEALAARALTFPSRSSPARMTVTCLLLSEANRFRGELAVALFRRAGWEPRAPVFEQLLDLVPWLAVSLSTSLEGSLSSSMLGAPAAAAAAPTHGDGADGPTAAGDMPAPGQQVLDTFTGQSMLAAACRQVVDRFPAPPPLPPVPAPLGPSDPAGFSPDPGMLALLADGRTHYRRAVAWILHAALAPLGVSLAGVATQLDRALEERRPVGPPRRPRATVLGSLDSYALSRLHSAILEKLEIIQLKSALVGVKQVGVKDLEILEQIGEGSFCKVFLGVYKQRANIAVKQVAVVESFFRADTRDEPPKCPGLLSLSGDTCLGVPDGGSPGGVVAPSAGDAFPWPAHFRAVGIAAAEALDARLARHRAQAGRGPALLAAEGFSPPHHQHPPQWQQLHHHPHQQQQHHHHHHHHAGHEEQSWVLVPAPGAALLAALRPRDFPHLSAAPVDVLFGPAADLATGAPGGSGRCARLPDPSTGRLLAAVLPPARALRPESEVLRLCREARILSQLSHPNIIRFLGVHVKPHPVVLSSQSTLDNYHRFGGSGKMGAVMEAHHHHHHDSWHHDPYSLHSPSDSLLDLPLIGSTYSFDSTASGSGPGPAAGPVDMAGSSEGAQPNMSAHHAGTAGPTPPQIVVYSSDGGVTGGLLPATSRHFFILTEFADGGSLHQAIHSSKARLPLWVKLKLALDVARGMEYLHTRPNPVIHRDLNPQNVLLVFGRPGAGRARADPNAAGSLAAAAAAATPSTASQLPSRSAHSRTLSTGLLGGQEGPGGLGGLGPAFPSGTPLSSVSEVPGSPPGSPRAATPPEAPPGPPSLDEWDRNSIVLRAVVADFGESQLLLEGDVDPGASGSRPAFRQGPATGPHFRDMTKQPGNLRYMAPEVFLQADYSTSADVYSFGLCLWELLAEATPFAGQPPAYVAFHMANHDFRPALPSDRATLHVPAMMPATSDYVQAPAPTYLTSADSQGSPWPPGVVSLIRECWSASPARRPSFSTIVTQLGDILNQVARSTTAVAPFFSAEPPAAINGPVSPEPHHPHSMLHPGRGAIPPLPGGAGPFHRPVPSAKYID
ncbi:TKL/MLK protein kinase [Fonticula alba]|uniref:TKL/MLK protein kinase n=1 Tax=Fonticula alba TaxID=691883 RepID=A0A058Z9W0_FONAL|nr:TKL/MLK protein kinase [Fonticula alba]KCV71010.1 TKL/MLK protein kinase [Fonticula alba]|eukprot:XP_009494133.1 TKL/MLK protein kinase [Fonticula alba]